MKSSNRTPRSILVTLLCVCAASQVSAQIPHDSGQFDEAIALSDAKQHEHPDALEAARNGGPDSDGDGQDDYEDNCRTVSNPNQLDADSDGFGNVCDGDLNNDMTVNFVDFSILSQAFLSSPGQSNWNPNADFNGDNVVNFVDIAQFPNFFLQSPGPSGMACAGQVACPAAQLTFAWPMSGQDADEWVINNYVDLNPGSGVTDFTGGFKSYNGHQGIDIDVPTFREMDNDFPILAVAQGTVLAFEDGNFDRNTSCTGSWNFVTVGHPNGYKTIYGHLKKDSVVVNVGDVVDAGTVLGVVGSSGCSTAPHLHLETLDENGVVVEPFADGMWVSPPVYDTLIDFMDATLYDTPINNVDMIKDPAANVTSVAAGSTFGIGLSMGGGEVGDDVNMRILKAGAVVTQNTIDWPGVLRHSFWWWNYTFASDAVGAHTLEIRVNGVLKATYPITVTTPGLTGFTQVRHGVASANYQALFDLLTANGYRPIWVDGYQVGGSTFFNAIFNKSTVQSWSSAHNLTSSGYQSYFTTQTQAGRRLVHLDSYRVGNSIRYAPIFVEQPIGPLWVSYHNATTAQHQTNFNTYASQGYRASHISYAEDSNGTLRVSALYDKAQVGGWVALSNMTSAQYQANFTTQTNAGRILSYLNGYSVNGSPRFSAIWDTVVPSNWVARHNLTSAQFQTNFDTWTSQGLNTRFITGYDNGSGIQNFGGFWSN
ncbi:MAG: peptidoglycan DD-metalloendopeptidase family protein [Gammaproteobacteria bacterium]